MTRKVFRGIANVFARPCPAATAMMPAFAKSALDRPSLVLNKSWIAIRVTSIRRAMCLMYGDAAFAVDAQSLQIFDFEAWCHQAPEYWAPDDPSRMWIKTPSGRIAVPEVIQLRGYNKVPAYDAPFTRRNLFERDDHTCQYCGARASNDRLSIDHVVPRSRGGPTTWNNCVLACVRCNSTKGDRLPREAGLHLLRKPKPPRWTPYLNLGRGEMLDSWGQFTVPSRKRISVARR